jgi:hypothetical protein
MQAGEKLSFVTPFTAEQHVDNEEQESVAQAFLYIQHRLLAIDPTIIKSVERLHTSGFITAVEASYRVKSPDGSYLHVLAFEHRNDGGLIDAGISVVEHTDTGIYKGGYIYYLDNDGLIRDTCEPSDDEDDTTHFSLLELYQDTDTMEIVLGQSDDELMQQKALELKAQLDEDILISAMEKEMGFDQQTPSTEEMISLQLLLRHAEPFMPPSSNADEDIYR